MHRPTGEDACVLCRARRTAAAKDSGSRRWSSASCPAPMTRAEAESLIGRAPADWATHPKNCEGHGLDAARATAHAPLAWPAERAASIVAFTAVSDDARNRQRQDNAVHSPFHHGRHAAESGKRFLKDSRRIPRPHAHDSKRRAN